MTRQALLEAHAWRWAAPLSLVLTLALVGGCELVASSPDATATWTVEPGEPDPEFRAAADERCLDGGRPDPATAEVLQDQRGSGGAAFLYTGRSQATCVVLRVPGLLPSWDVPSKGWRLWPYESDAALAVGDSGSGAISDAYGVVDPSAVAVEIVTTSGRTVRATVGGGRFLAWWPGSDPWRAVRALAADGTVLDSVAR
jgi:hypothetical protein